MSHSDENGTVLDTPEDIQMFGLLQAAHRLSLEINTGMKFRQSTLSALQRAGITTKKTKKAALNDLVGVIVAANPNYVPGATMLRALGASFGK